MSPPGYDGRSGGVVRPICLFLLVGCAPEPASYLPREGFDDAFATVDPARGRRWVRDETFHLLGFAVPHVFVGPGGRFGMLVTNMQLGGDNRARWVLWSDDGREWTDGGPLLLLSAAPYDCGGRFQDAAMWRETPDTWTVVAEGTEVTTDGFSEDPHHLCPASTADFESFTWGDAPMWSGAFPGDLFSVPSIISFAAEGSFLFYNGDILRETEGGPGIRVARLGADRTVTPLVTEPMMREEHVDPMPVFLEGGGVRLYHARFRGAAGESGLRWVDLDDDLLPVDDGELLLPSPGLCDVRSVGECFYDPSFVALPTGELYLYFGDIVWHQGGGLEARVGRAVAVD